MVTFLHKHTPTMMKHLAIAGLALLNSLACAAPANNTHQTLKRADSLKFDFGNTKIRGVNLGGWLLLEPWITPSIFEATPDNVIDEYNFCQTLGSDVALQRLQQHWSTWITADDFSLMKQYGLNFVRIPIGYWSIAPVPGDPYVQGAYEYLGQALDWASASDLMVMIDLHGAPGSQNGFDNSGRRGPIDWTKGDTIAQTHAALNRIRDDHAAHPAVAAIELVNEPMGPALDMGTVRQFYADGWGDLQDSRVAVTFHDAFLGVDAWTGWGAGLWALLEDTHFYQVFDVGSLRMGVDQHVASACTFGVVMAGNNKWTVAGEFTGAQTDCAKWLNGRGVGARYDGTIAPDMPAIGSCDGKYMGTAAGLGVADRNNIRSFVEAQFAAFERAAGWIFWTWRTESAPEWDFRGLVQAGIIPQPLDAFRECI